MRYPVWGLRPGSAPRETGHVRTQKNPRGGGWHISWGRLLLNNLLNPSIYPFVSLGGALVGPCGCSPSSSPTTCPSCLLSPHISICILSGRSSRTLWLFSLFFPYYLPLLLAIPPSLALLVKLRGSQLLEPRKTQVTKILWKTLK
jgi:hypothetical protein